MGVVIVLMILGLPIAEIAGFVVIGGRIGVLATLAWVMLAAIAGLAVLRLQGLATALQMRASLARDELPARALFDGALVAIAGFLLLIPGFVSDAIAILLLLPPLRSLLFHLAARQVSAHVQVNIRGGARSPGRPWPGSEGPGSEGPGPEGPVIEGEFSEVHPDRDADDDGDHRRLPGGGGRAP